MSEHRLSKSNYIQYINCPEELWLQKNRPDLVPPLDLNALHKIEQGNLIDEIAQELFEEGAIVHGEELKAENIFFQQRVEHESFIAIADVTLRDPVTNTIDIYEVKGSTKLKQDHVDDVAFQKMVFELAGYNVRDCYVILVNNQYVFRGQLDPWELLTVKDITGKVAQKVGETLRKANEALEWIKGEMPEKRITLGCPNKLKCPFVTHHYPDLPEYSIFDIARIRQPKLEELMKNDILEIKDVPEGFPLSEKQAIQVALAKSKDIHIDLEAIKDELSALEFPLYFLDYETFSYVIPVQRGHVPYQQMLFQYSLHVLKKPGGIFKHYEYLLKDKEEGIDSLVKDLKNNIPKNKGTVLVWNKGFEASRNKEVARILPKYSIFLHSLNDRMYDLAEIFQNGLYNHPEFKGSYSIKKVLPVLCPELKYSDLEIQNGSNAVIQWHKMTSVGEMDKGQAQKTYEALLAYCKMDTWAMVRIWQELSTLIREKE